MYMQSNEVKGSYHMEKEGLVRAVKFLKKKKFRIATLVTDRHKQIAKWTRENIPSTDHRYDIWHLAKCRLFALSSCKYEVYYYFQHSRKRLMLLQRKKIVSW